MSKITQTVSLDINKDDIVAIAVSRAERALTQREQDLQAQVKELEKQITEKTKKLQEACIQYMEGNVVASLDQIRKDLATLGSTAKIDYNVDRRYKKFHVTLSAKCHNYTSTIALLDYTFSHLLTDGIDNDITALEEKKHNTQLEVIVTRKKLNNIGALERSVRGKLAEERLGTSPEGRKILQAILDNFDDLVALPS